MKTILKMITGFFLTAVILIGCTKTGTLTTVTPDPIITPAISTQSDASFTQYAFPSSIDPAGKYLFYLHGKIIEDQGISGCKSGIWRV